MQVELFECVKKLGHLVVYIEFLCVLLLMIDIWWKDVKWLEGQLHIAIRHNEMQFITYCKLVFRPAVATSFYRLVVVFAKPCSLYFSYLWTMYTVWCFSTSPLNYISK